nr:FoF1 ATP synthase subunit B' [uncultured Campylobacter sp.]
MLEIDLPLVALTAVVFLALIAILNSVLYKPLLGFVDKRNQDVKNDEDSISKNTSDLSVFEAQVEQILSAARAEAGKIKQDAINAAKEAAGKITAEKRAELEVDYDAFVQNLKAQKNEFKAELMNSLPELRSALKSKLARI